MNSPTKINNTYYQELGRADRPTLVLIHGLMGDHTGLQSVAKLLAKHYHILLPDLPGHGQSDALTTEYDRVHMARALTEFLQAKKVHKPIIIGHSYGAAVALAYSLQSKLHPAKLILLAPYPRYRLNVANVATTVGVGTIARLPQPLPERVMSSQLFSELGGELLFVSSTKQQRKQLIEQGRAATALFRLPAAASIARDMRQFEIAPELQQLTLPTYIIYGDKDRFGGFAQEVKKLTNPHITIKELPGEGHLFPLENPERTAKLIVDWLSA